MFRGSPGRHVQHCLCLLLLLGLPLFGAARHVRVRRVFRRSVQQDGSRGNSSGGNSTGGNSTRIINELIVLGDSYSDTGRSFALSNGTDPSPKWYWDGRFSSGPIWVDYLTAAANGLPYAANDTNYPVKWDNATRPTLSGLNYTASTNGTALNVLSLAVGGAPACYQNRDYAAQQNQSIVQPPWLAMQIDDFENVQNGTANVGGNVTLGPASKRAIVIEFGANDYLNQLQNISASGDFRVQFDKLPDLISNCIQSGIQRLLRLGEKNIIVFSLPIISQLPQAQLLDIPELTELLREQADRTNQAIQQVVTQLQGNSSDTLIRMYDLGNATAKIVNNPAMYNITNAQGTCLKYSSPAGEAVGKIPVIGDELENAANKLVGSDITGRCNDPSTYVFHDRVHPTSHTHSLIGRDIAAQLQQFGLR